MKNNFSDKHTVKKAIIIYEMIGFCVVVTSLWLNEIFDFPHFWFGAVKTPINWTESIIETILVCVLCVFVISLSWRCLERIRYLEKFVHVCVFCKRVRVDNKWIPIDLYIQEHSETKISHGLCSECMEKHYGLKSEDRNSHVE